MTTFIVTVFLRRNLQYLASFTKRVDYINIRFSHTLRDYPQMSVNFNKKWKKEIIKVITQIILNRPTDIRQILKNTLNPLAPEFPFKF